MSNAPCGWRRHVDEDDVAVAVFFVALDTAVTLLAARGGRRVRTGLRRCCWRHRG